MSANLLSEALDTGTTDMEALKSYVTIIERNAASMDRMINDLLDVERMASSKITLQMKTDNFCQILLDCREMFTSVAESKGITFEVDPCDQAILANFDADRILQVLSNLVGNAFKFTPRDGSVKVSIKVLAREIEVSVQDTGPGIVAEKRLKIFERYTQLASKDRKGLGLGLFISKWIVEAHRGRIWVDSNPGQGSAFKFTLPLPVSQ